jgi:hypothetical protein
MEAALVEVLQGRLNSMGAHRIYAIRLCREVATVLRLHAGRHPTEVRIADEQHQAQRRDDPLVAGGWEKMDQGISTRPPGKCQRDEQGPPSRVNRRALSLQLVPWAHSLLDGTQHSHKLRT